MSRLRLPRKEVTCHLLYRPRFRMQGRCERIERTLIRASAKVFHGPSERAITVPQPMDNAKRTIYTRTGVVCETVSDQVDSSHVAKLREKVKGALSVLVMPAFRASCGAVYYTSARFAPNLDLSECRIMYKKQRARQARFRRGAGPCPRPQRARYDATERQRRRRWFLIAEPSFRKGKSRSWARSSTTRRSSYALTRVLPAGCRRA